MFKKFKSFLSVFICMSMLLCNVIPIIGYAAETSQLASRLFSTDRNNTLLSKAVDAGLTYGISYIESVTFVDLDDYDLSKYTTADFSANGDGSILAWYRYGSGLFIGGREKVVAGDSLAYAFSNGTNINKINGLEFLDTSNVTDMEGMFENCGTESSDFTLDLGDNFDTSNVTNMAYMFSRCGFSNKNTVFTLDLGDKFDTSNVTDMQYMFEGCGEYSEVFTLDLGDKFNTSNVTNMSAMFSACGVSSKAYTLDLGDNFDTSKVTNMQAMFMNCGQNSEIFTLNLGDKFDTANVTDMGQMFDSCGESSKKFKELDLSGFTFSFNEANYLRSFAENIPVTRFIFGEGWENIYYWSSSYYGYALFKCQSTTPTTVIGATDNLLSYDWESDNRTVTFLDKTYYTITALTDEGGTVSGNGTVLTGGDTTLVATPNKGYKFDGWYDGDTKVCDTEEFTIENVTADKTYSAKFTEKIHKTSKLFSTASYLSRNGINLLSKAVNAGIVDSESSIKIVSFVDLNDYDLTDITTVDYSADGDSSVLAWFDETNSELYIGGYETIIAGDSLCEAFYQGTNIEAINGFDILDVSNVTDMSSMFQDCGSDSQSFALDLGDNFDTSNVTDMAWMFLSCGTRCKDFTLDLGDKFNTSKVTNMDGMFQYCAWESEAFTLDLGDLFDTSNVTNMNAMFLHTGRESKCFTLDLGDKFNTSKVTNMDGMFCNCGEYSDVFRLDLGDKFDTSNVTNMNGMFSSCGGLGKRFRLNLGNNFDTSNVTDMDGMFSACAKESKSFTLDLGDKFDTSKVTDMQYMFYQCGQSSLKFKEFDLSGFTISFSDSKNLKYFAYNVPATSFIFGAGWANAVLPESNMFAATATTPTLITGASDNLVAYDWVTDKRSVIFTDKNYFTITANAQTGGTVSGGGSILEGANTTLTATANSGYSFDGWYEGDTKVCDTEEFTIENVTADKTYTAKFTKDIVYYTITAVAQTGGTVSGGGSILEGTNVTLLATTNDGYTFDGWYEGDTKVCDTEEFTVENVSADKTYTAKFTKNAPKFDFTSLRTLRTKNITVDHQTKTIDIQAADGAENITILVHQKEVIPGGTFRMASYLGNKVVYDPNGSYRIYFVNNFTVTVKANITIDGVTEQYTVNVNFDSSKAKFDFTSLKGENFGSTTVNHTDKTIHITANESADNIILYVNQHSTVYGGKLRMASYLGNKVKYDASGVYTIYANGKNSVSVKTNITINGVTEQYLITIDFPSVVWGFDTVNAENVKNVSIDHENKVITIDTVENCTSILLYIDQTCEYGVKSQIWMKSYMGNKVVYNSADRTYTISKKDKSSITVKTKITMLGETRYYDIVINFTENN